VNPALQPVDRPAHNFELRVIVRCERGFTLRLQLANASFDTRLVDADHVVMLVLNAEGFREANDQVRFIHLRVALDGIVFDAFGDLAQVGKVFVFEFFDCVRHANSYRER
jgi:hypothetical protein